jgi:hypothetical protein
MKSTSPISYLFGSFLLLSPGVRAATAPASLQNLKVIEAVNSVEITDESTRKKHSAKVDETFHFGSVLATGAKSRAELNAPDGTVTRVGANSLFSINEQKREINLQKGTLLFHSPTGKGGGTIKSPGATAGVVGTSIIVSATSDGGFKLLVLEGSAKATLPGGKSISIGAGQLTFIQRGSMGFGPVVNFRLRDQVAGAKLVGGFKAPLGSLQKIKDAVETQEKKIAEGKLEGTPLQVAGSALVDSSLIQLRAGDGTSLQRALATDVTVTNGMLEKNRLFTYANANVPPELLALLGPGAAAGLAGSPGERASYFVGRNINALGPQDDILAGYSLPLFVFAARDTLTIDEGRSMSDSELLNPGLEISGAGYNFYDPDPDPSLWFVAGQKIAISNTKVDMRGDVMVVGSFFVPETNYGSSAYTSTNFVAPAHSVELKNAALLNGGGDIVVTGAKITAVESSVIATQNVAMMAGAIDINSAVARDILAGYGRDQVGNEAASKSGSQLLMYANDTLSVQNARLGGAQVSLDARTVVLEGVDFKSGSQVQISSGLGVLADSPNTGQPVDPRKVNFIRQVTYGGQPAQNFTGQPSSPITFRANGR